MIKILVPNSVYTWPGQENFERNRKKIKKLKNLFPELFLAKTGVDRPKKGEKKICPDFRSYLAWVENSGKNSEKIKKIKKSLSGIIFSQNRMRSAEKKRKKI